MPARRAKADLALRCPAAAERRSGSLFATTRLPGGRAPPFRAAGRSEADPAHEVLEARIPAQVLPLGISLRGRGPAAPQKVRTIFPTKLPDSRSFKASSYWGNGISRSMTGLILCTVMKSDMRR